MPIRYLASLTAHERTARANLHLGVSLAFVAGALNAGGFLAIGQYTSHMTGMVSMAADEFALGHAAVVVSAVLSVLAFVLGAGSTAVMVNYARRNHARNAYMPALLLEAMLLLVFGVAGAHLRRHELIDLSLTAILLCYTMGLQNALITKISNAEIRTTHVTGLLTDIGIELGKLFYWNRTLEPAGVGPVLANRRKLWVHLALVAAFAVGGLAGAFGFKHLGFSATIPLAVALVGLSLAPAFSGRRKIGAT